MSHWGVEAEAPRQVSAPAPFPENGPLLAMLEAIPDPVLLLNGEGLVVGTNRRLQQLLTGRAPGWGLGRRTGELLNCSYAAAGDKGCGTSRWCPHCGALQAVIEAQAGQCQVRREVTLFLDAQNMLEVEVVASPLMLDGTAATLCVLRDLSAEKQRQMLERVFFHDIMNTLGGLRGVAEVLRREDILPPADVPRYHAWLIDLSEQLVEEIDQQRKLLAAERGEFTPEWAAFAVDHLLEQVRHAYERHTVADGRVLRVTGAGELIAVSDATILRRIVGNLVKNALEASAPGEEVLLAASLAGEALTFRVQNPGVIPLEIQRQLFSRAVSTKAAVGRGLGTYSAKLFTERYLGGVIGFSSTPEQGTSFWLTIPRTGPAGISPA